MKQCPDCSAQYDDNVSFCAKDGRALAVMANSRMRLCPHCANSIQESATRCPYCKADSGSAGSPQWPTREEVARQAAPAARASRLSLRSKVILVCGFVVFALGVFFLGGHQERSETRQLQESRLKELQTREQKIQTLEEQLKQARQEAGESATRVAALTTKLDESQKELSSMQQRLASANRAAERTTPTRAPANPRSPRRAAEPATSPQPTTSAARRTAEPGVYEVIQVTSVRENPSATARAVAEIKKGTKVTVVRSVGEWLEVQSKQGNPPGYIRSNDAMFIRQAN
ncbi:MAG: SH3 domain-containing protein [Candidatus Binatia bacterium]